MTETMMELQAELNVAWMRYVRDTERVIELLPNATVRMLRTTFEAGYVAGSLRELEGARHELEGLVDPGVMQ